MFELEARAEPSRLMSWLSPLLAVVLMLGGGVLVFWALGKDPVEGFRVFFLNPLKGLYSLSELLLKAMPLMLCATGLAIGFRANVWNIGAEGQFIMGGIVGSMLPVLFPELRFWFVLPLMLLMGMAGGALYAGIPAILKVRFNTNEILTSLMLVYVAQLFLDWLVRGPWRNPAGMNFPGTVRFHDYAVLPELLPASGRAHWGFVFALVAALVVWFVLSKTLKGFEVKVLGQSPRAGRFAGFSSGRMVVFAFLVSGALAGLAGISEVSGAVRHLNEKLSIGYGFTAIIVAFLGRLNPLGIVAAGLVLALTYLGGEAAQISVGLSDKVVRAFQGLILFFVLACDTLIHYRIRLIRPRAAAAREANHV